MNNLRIQIIMILLFFGFSNLLQLKFHVLSSVHLFWSYKPVRSAGDPQRVKHIAY